MNVSRLQNVLQTQSSVNSTTSVQTVFHQATLQNQENCHSTRSNSYITPTLLHQISTSSSSTCSAGQLSQPNVDSQQLDELQDTLPLHRPAGSITSLLEHINPTIAMSSENVLNIADVADLLHPQHAIITGNMILVFSSTVFKICLLYQQVEDLKTGVR